MQEGQFPSERRIHVGLEVADLGASKKFYETLLGMAPTKTRPGYAKFESIDPAVHLSLAENPAARPAGVPGSGHFGIQLQDADALSSARARMIDAGYGTRDEEDVTCCYARSDKAWVSDPDGNAWEMFVFRASAESMYEPPPAQKGDAGAERACCSPTCCTGTDSP